MSAPVIQNVAVGSIAEAPDNPNHMDKASFDQLCAAMGKKGMLQPILVRSLQEGYRVVDGHHRLRAAKVLGMESVASVVVHCSDADEKVLRIGMNRLRGELDLTATAAILKELAGAGLGLDELALTGFSEGEVSDLIGAVSQDPEVNVQEVQLPPESDYAVEDEGSSKPLVLEIEFATAADKKTAVRGLKRAAGKGKDLATGLLKLLVEESTARKEAS